MATVVFFTDVCTAPKYWDKLYLLSLSSIFTNPSIDSTLYISLGEKSGADWGISFVCAAVNESLEAVGLVEFGSMETAIELRTADHWPSFKAIKFTEVPDSGMACHTRSIVKLFNFF